jgi:hypothetical protein
MISGAAEQGKAHLELKRLSADGIFKPNCCPRQVILIPSPARAESGASRQECPLHTFR